MKQNTLTCAEKAKRCVFFLTINKNLHKASMLTFFLFSLALVKRFRLFFICLDQVRQTSFHALLKNPSKMYISNNPVNHFYTLLYNHSKVSNVLPIVHTRHKTLAVSLVEVLTDTHLLFMV